MPAPKRSHIKAPSAKAVAQVEKAATRISANTPEIDAWAQSYLKSHVQRIATDIDLLGRFTKPGAKIVELGSAPFLFTLAAQDQGFQVTGVDVDPSRFSTCLKAEDMTVLAANFETEPVPLPDGSAETLVMNEVFEHLRIDLIGTLEEVHRLLAPGGRLLLSTPNLKSARGMIRYLFKGKSTSIAEDIYGEYQKLRTLGHMGHVREYSPVEVAEFLERVGFEVSEVIYRGRHRRRLYRRMGRLYPPLMPFFTIVAAKRAT